MTECIYQGSFNPIHNAHLAVAEHVYKTLQPERIVFIPAFRPPHKNSSDFDVKNAFHRLEMLQLALEDIPYFDVSAIEYMRNKPSYTYDTVIQISKLINRNEKIKFIIGSDAFIQIESWYKTEELKHLLDFVLFVRNSNFDESPFEKLKEKGYNYTLMNMTYINISSSLVRNYCKKGIPIDNIVPAKVAEYIKKNNLYKE